MANGHRPKIRPGRSCLFFITLREGHKRSILLGIAPQSIPVQTGLKYPMKQFLFILMIGTTACLMLPGCCDYCAERGSEEIILEIRDAATGANLIDSLNLQTSDITLVSDLPAPYRYNLWHTGSHFQIDPPSILERDKLEDRLTLLVNGKVVEVLLITYNDGGEDSCCDVVSPSIDSLRTLGSTEAGQYDEGWRLVLFL